MFFLVVIHIVIHRQSPGLTCLDYTAIRVSNLLR